MGIDYYALGPILFFSLVGGFFLFRWCCTHFFGHWNGATEEPPLLDMDFYLGMGFAVLDALIFIGVFITMIS